MNKETCGDDRKYAVDKTSENQAWLYSAFLYTSSGVLIFVKYCEKRHSD